MYQFFFKKSFYNFSDSLLSAVITNMVIMLLAGIFLRGFVSLKSGYLFLGFVFFLVCYIIYGMFMSFFQFGYRNGFSFSKIKKVLLIAVFDSLVLFSSIKAIEFYFVSGNFLSYVLAFTAFWLLLFYVLSMFFHLPLILVESLELKDSLIKSFQFTITDPGKAILLMFFSVTSFATNFIPLFGFSFGAIMSCNMVSLLLKKEKYIHENVDSIENIRKINWNELLKEENENLGNRSFKDFIFPWR